MAIIKNSAQCMKCGDIIESKNRHDFVWCKCKAIAVDGGKDYIKRIGNKEDIGNMVIYMEEKK